MQLTEATIEDQLLGGGDTFHVWMPLEKSEKDGRRYIQGIASTADRDLQDEIVLPRGIDTRYFLENGYINDDHKDGPRYKVGEPTECYVKKAGLWLKAWLYKGKDRAEEWWNHITTLERNESNRKVGFSIQGKVLRRHGKTITKCWLQDIAITASPVNTNTWAEVVKSLSDQDWCNKPDSKQCAMCGGCDAGREEEEKALSAGGMGQIITPESLEGRAKVQTYKSTRIGYSEAIHKLRTERGYSLPMAKVVADAIFVTHGIH